VAPHLTLARITPSVPSCKLCRPGESIQPQVTSLNWIGSSHQGSTSGMAGIEILDHLALLCLIPISLEAESRVWLWPSPRPARSLSLTRVIWEDLGWDPVAQTPSSRRLTSSQMSRPSSAVLPTIRPRAAISTFALQANPSSPTALASVLTESRSLPWPASHRRPLLPRDLRLSLQIRASQGPGCCG
jgi:hypothetical protein